MPYLENWEKSVAGRKGFTKAEKKRMLLSDETVLGLRMTGMLMTPSLCRHYVCFLLLQQTLLLAWCITCSHYLRSKTTTWHF